MLGEEATVDFHDNVGKRGKAYWFYWLKNKILFKITLQMLIIALFMSKENRLVKLRYIIMYLITNFDFKTD